MSARLKFYPQARGRLYHEAGFLFDWRGGHTVNVRPGGARGKMTVDIDCFNVGDFALTSATVAEVEDGIQAWLAAR